MNLTFSNREGWSLVRLEADLIRAVVALTYDTTFRLTLCAHPWLLTISTLDMREKLHRSLPVGSKTFYWPCEHAYFTVDCSSKCQRITYASVFFLVTSWVSIFVHFGVSVIGMNAEGSWGRWECYLYLQVFTNEPQCWKILTSPTGGCRFRDQQSVRWEL